MPEDKKSTDLVRVAARRSAKGASIVAGQIEMELVRFRSDQQEIEFNLDTTKETVWATQQQIADLFGRDRDTIGTHIGNIFRDGELDRTATTANFAVVRQEGGRAVERNVEHYNLDIILSVGYRVSSARATKFRQWATQTLRAYIVDGFALNEVRLRDDPQALRELAAKVRELRATEKNIYAAVRDTFKISSIDYDAGTQTCKSFYAKVQDKFHFAVTQKTSAEIILERADHKKEQMGVKNDRR